MIFSKPLSLISRTIRRTVDEKSRASGSRNSQLQYERFEPKQLLAALPLINEFVASNSDSLIDDNGNSSDWIELFNAGDQSVNLVGYSLTDDVTDPTKYVLPSTTLSPGEYLVVFAGDDADPSSGTDLYTGFGLSSGGEYLGLYSPTGDVLSEFAEGGGDYPAQFSDVSYGFVNDGLFSDVSYFSTPSPAAANINAVDGVVDEVVSSVDRGFFDSSFSVTLSTETDGATIRYTTDGSTPTATNGTTYSGPITVSSTTTLRALGLKSGYLSVPDRTWSYFFVDDIVNQSNDGAAPAGFPAVGSSSQVLDYGIDPDVIGIEGVEAVKDALLSISTISITTDIDNLFDPQTGIYVNALRDGIDWERPASVELLNPDGTEGFQVNAGLRIRGGFSRVDSNAKHSFRVIFRGEYGDSELNYPIHGESGTDTFDKLDFRTAQNYSWSKDGDAENNFIQDVISRQNQGLTGQLYTRSSWQHLYLNGQYWGLFQTQERVDSDFAASYLGGDKDDFDVIKVDAGPGAPRTVVASDGDLDAYNRLAQQTYALDSDGSSPNFVNNEAYFRVQGLNPDGTRNEAYEVLLDVDNLVDYMTEILYSGNFDAPITQFGRGGNASLNNFQAIRDRTGDEGFQFFVHDAEHSLRSLDENRNGPYNKAVFDSQSSFNPQTLHQRLMANAEYRIAFADSIQAKFFNDGIYTTENVIERWDAEAAKISSAIIGESARWGDAESNSPLLKSDWEQAVANVRDNILANRNDVFLTQLSETIVQLRDGDGDYTIDVDAPLLPSVDAPSFLIDGVDQSGGEVPAGASLSLGGTEGTIYYTTDGTDPRLVGGGISSDAIAYETGVTSTEIFGEGAQWKYFNQYTSLDGVDWQSSSFDDNNSQWTSGAGQLGYGDGDEATVVGFAGPDSNKNITTYFRKTFNVAAGSYLSASLDVLRDDGVAIYLNGVEIGRDNLDAGALFNTTANSVSEGIYSFSFDPSLLQAGENTLAVEIHQIRGSSSDISFDAALTVTESTSTSGPVTLNASTNVLARTLSNGEWSALHDATFTLPATRAEVRISEVYYHPSDPSSDENGAGFIDKDEFEFVEIINPTDAPVSLAGIEFVEGITFSFPDVVLGPGESAVVVENVDAFRLRFGSDATVLGQWAGGLSNGGETLVLNNAFGETLHEFTYDDAAPWPTSPDGGGASLNVVDFEGDYNLSGNWVASAPTPGVADFGIGRGVLDVIVSGSGFLAGFVDAVDGDGIGAGNGVGYSLAGDHQLESLPWNNIDTLYVQFTGDVSATLTDGSVLLRGTNGGDYDLGQISVDANNVATIPVLDGIGTDSLVLTIFEGTVSTSNGTVIAGSDGGQFDFFFNVLVGDADGSGQVNSSDAFAVFGSNADGANESNFRRDIDGSGQINSSDAFAAFANNANGLPDAPTPPIAPASIVSSPLAIAASFSAESALVAAESVSSIIAPAAVLTPVASVAAPVVSSDSVAVSSASLVSSFETDSVEIDRVIAPAVVSVADSSPELILSGATLTATSPLFDAGLERLEEQKSLEVRDGLFGDLEDNLEDLLPRVN